MHEQITIVPTCVAENFADLSVKLARIRTFSQSAHLDIDDGMFVEAISWPYMQRGVAVDLSAEHLDQGIEAHLMVSDCATLGASLAGAGITRLIAHVESLGLDSAATTIQEWRTQGATHVSLAILLDTPLDALSPVGPFIDSIQVMSVGRLGAQGASFDERAVGRVASIKEHYPELLVAVDGGVSQQNIRELVRAGARRFAVGSAIMNALEPQDEYQRLKSAAESALQ